MKRARSARPKEEGIAVTRGSSERTRFTLAQGPSILMPRTAATKSAGSADASTSPRKVRLGSAFDRHEAGADLAAVRKGHAQHPAVRGQDLLDGRPRPDLHPEAARPRRHGLRMAPIPPITWP